MEGRITRIFWTIFVAFCITTVTLLEFLDLIELSEMGIVEDLILIIALIATGVLLRLWFDKNPEEIKKIFKL